MGAELTKKTGIPNIDRANTQSIIIFSAIHFARTENPDINLTETVARVIKAFGLNISVQAAERRYYFTLNTFLGNEPDEQ